MLFTVALTTRKSVIYDLQKSATYTCKVVSKSTTAFVSDFTDPYKTRRDLSETDERNLSFFLY